MRYRTLLLDADGTILDFDRSEAEALRGTLLQFGMPVNAEWIRDYHEINDRLWKQLERGEILKKDLRWVRFSKLLELHGVSGDVHAMADHYVKELGARAYMLPGAEEACRTLAKAYRLFIITNGIAAVQQRRLGALPIFNLFQKIYISEEVGFEKPDIRYFQRVAADIPDYDPVTTLVVGDSLSSDIAGGIAAGLDTCWINPKLLPIPADLPIRYTVPSMTALAALLMRNEEDRL